MPTCGRCARRNKVEQCIYHPAPLTRALPTPHPSESDAGQSPTSGHQAYEDSSELLSTGQPITSVRSGDSSIQNVASQLGSLNEQTWIPSPSFQRNTGFLGATSYSAILSENEVSIGIGPANSESILNLITDVSQTYMQRGADVLFLLKDMPLFNRFIERWFSLSRGIVVIEPMVKQWAGSLWSTHHKVLEAQKPERLLELSESVWQNTLKPLKFNGKTIPREFVAMFTGEHLRWEVVGIIFSVVGMLAMTLLDGDPIFCTHDDEPLDRKHFALEAWNASETCLAFCNEFDILNDLYIWMLYENTVLSSSLHTKGSDANWQKSGQLNNALLAFGLHQEIKVDDETPFFITEFRKKTFVTAYSNDKYTATFFGRPPRLSHRYCLLQLPLDLNDNQTMSDGLDLDNAIATLDDEGWNQRGTIHRCTFARIFAQNARIREDILEISLGVFEEDIVSRAETIERRTIQMWESLPQFLRLDSQNPWNIKRAPVELLFLVYIRLENLNHHFLLQRTLIKRASTDTIKLLATAKDIFSNVLTIVNNRDSIRDFQIDFMLIICTHGLPSSAVLAVELLRQEQNGGCMSEPLPRSETIQDLSVFVACLGSIRPDNGSYSICERGRRFLKRILDTILSPGPAATPGLSSLGPQDPSWSTPLFSGNDGDFMRWLETMECEQGSWTNFN